MSRYPEIAGIPVAPKVKFDIVEFAEEHLVDPVALALYLDDNHITEVEEASEYLGHFEDSYVGFFEGGLPELAEELLADGYGSSAAFNELLTKGYIDIDRVVRDLEAEGWRDEANYIFRPA